MPAGDLIVKDGQYEYNGILFNDAVDGDAVRVIRTQGLFDLPDVKSNEVDTAEDHGGSIGRTVLAMRRIIMEFTVLASTSTLMHTKTRSIAAALQPYGVVLPLVYQRPGIGKQFLNVRVSKFTGFDTTYEKEHGESPATAMLVAPDPRKLAFVQSSQVLTILSGGTTVSGSVSMAGDFIGGAKPIFEIAGPVTNPRISNAQDENRS